MHIYWLTEISLETTYGAMKSPSKTDADAEYLVQKLSLTAVCSRWSVHMLECASAILTTLE